MSELHKCNIIDDESPFIINPDTRAVERPTDGSNKRHQQIIVQGDKNAERFRFKAPLEIEGHDMSECDRIEIHYINVNSSGDQTSSGIYTVKDAEVVDNEIEFSWLLSSTATKYAGTLSFAVKFICGDPETTSSDADYVWNTRPLTAANVEEGYDNKPVIIDANISACIEVLQEWYSRFDTRLLHKTDTMSFVDEQILRDPEPEEDRVFNEELYAELLAKERVYMENSEENGRGLNSLYVFHAGSSAIYNPYGYRSLAELCAARDLDIDKVQEGTEYVIKIADRTTSYHPRMYTSVARKPDGSIKGRVSNSSSNDTLINKGYADGRYVKRDETKDLLDTNVKLSSQLKTHYNVGKITTASGTNPVPIGEEGDSLRDVFNNLFVMAEDQPTIKTHPSVRLTLSSSESDERGTTISSLSYSITFEDGAYSTNDTTGCKMGTYSFSDGTPSSTTLTSGTLTLTEDYIVGQSPAVEASVTAQYSEGNIAKTNLGNNSNPVVQISAGSCTSPSASFSKTAVDYPYYISNSASTINGLKGITISQKSTNLTTNTGAKFDYYANAYVWIFVRKGDTTSQPTKTIQAYSDIAKDWGSFLGGTELMGTIDFVKANDVEDTFFAYRTKNTAGAGDYATFRLK
ncbi:MAG: hypothetical protein J6Q84_07400 [Kiritimatiellae bacterium]|nr:hypothetical protein [Kiritimatiellia bacterium]